MSLAAMKLGRIAPSEEQRARAPKLSRYLRAPLPLAPASVDNTDGAVYQMYANDRLGDCTIAGIGNYFATVAAKEGSCLAFTEDQVTSYYYKLGNGKDRGLVETVVLDHVKEHGFPLDGSKKLAAWVSVRPNDIETIKSLTSIFWCMYLGVQLPITAQHQEVWDVDLGPDADPDSWGGHCLVMPAYSPEGPTFITWGEKKKATWAWFHAYVDEAYCLLDEDRAREYGVKWDELLADLDNAKD